MAKEFLAAELETIIASTEAIPIAYARASSLEAEAAELRTSAVEDQALAFETASDVLREQYEAGVLSPVEIVRVIATLNDLDPAMLGLYRSKRGTQAVQAFEALQPGTPVIGISAFEFSYTGIVTEAPEITTIHFQKKSRDPIFQQPFMAPYAEITVPLRTILGHDEEAQEITATVEIFSLVATVIGRAGIQEQVQKATFTTTSDNARCHPGTITNGATLQSLKSQIDKLHRLGMESVDTQALDKALVQNDNYRAAQRRRSANNIAFRRRRDSRLRRA